LREVLDRAILATVVAGTIVACSAFLASHYPLFAMRSADDASQADRDVPIEAFVSLGALTCRAVCLSAC